MDPSEITLEQIEEALQAHEPVDAITLEMLPEESRVLTGLAPDYIRWLIDGIRHRDNAQSRLSLDLAQLKAALQMYAQQGGDVMFNHNLELCLNQVKQQS